MVHSLTVEQGLGGLQPSPQTVVLKCGVAGSGKTTFAKRLETIGFCRLSIDEEIWDRFGRYGIDYQPSEYGGHVATARSTLRDQLERHLAGGRDAIVVDSSFWSQAHRDDFKRLIESSGGTWRLVYLKVPEQVLRRRLLARSTRFDANAALPIDDEMLRSFLETFEAPSGEGEIVVDVG